ncbi:MAG: hypothetical protein HQM12_20060 [SAR324 cluster bacterium]|nr:hypothetical protein [SAR324 cluster bacterium]
MKLPVWLLLLGLCLPVQSFARTLLFIHGMNDSFTWEPLHPFLKQEMGLTFGGTLSVSPELVDGYHPDRGDYFFLKFSSDKSHLEILVSEVAQAMEKLYKDRKELVEIIGFSVGGVATRLYLIDKPINHHVKKLITFHSPHQGTAWAYFSEVRRIAYGCKSNPLCDKICEIFYKLGDNRVEADILLDLIPPNYEKPTGLLAIKNVQAHPLDVEYVSVVGEAYESKNMNAAIEKLKEGFNGVMSGDVFMPFGYEITHFVQSLFLGEGGDGAVSIYSQNMANLPWFKNKLKIVKIQRLEENEFIRFSVRERSRLTVIKTHSTHEYGATNFKLMSLLIRDELWK